MRNIGKPLIKKEGSGVIQEKSKGCLGNGKIITKSLKTRNHMTYNRNTIEN